MSATDLYVRWMIRRDMPDILRIEEESFEYGWTEEDFLRCLRQKNCIGMTVTAKNDSEVVGYLIYELNKNSVGILNMAVSPTWRRLGACRANISGSDKPIKGGVATAMVLKILSKLSEHRRTRAFADIRESNLAAQLFFRSVGFKASRVLRSFYEDSGEDAYRMELRLPSDLGIEEEEPDEIEA